MLFALGATAMVLALAVDLIAAPRSGPRHGEGNAASSSPCRLKPDFGFAESRARSMSHHYSGPDFGFPRGDARHDFTDLYAFPKPGDATKSVLVMNVHPSAVVNPPGLTTTEPFAPEALYELKIDTNGDTVADIS
jgi:hypothetical protein